MGDSYYALISKQPGKGNITKFEMHSQWEENLIAIAMNGYQISFGQC